jgi:adenosylcobinamide-phosphate synthase
MISPASFALAYALDRLIGDPTWLPHPVRWMGRMIKGGEGLVRRFSRAPGSEFIAGMVLTVIVVHLRDFVRHRLLVRGNQVDW